MISFHNCFVFLSFSDNKASDEDKKVQCLKPCDDNSNEEDNSLHVNHVNDNSSVQEFRRKLVFLFCLDSGISF